VDNFKLMWQPNKSQWWVIWIAVALALLFAANGTGVVGFGGAILVGALLVWQIEGKRPK
jgi:hypothetical protein